MALHFGVHGVSPKKDDDPFIPFVHIELTWPFKDDTGKVLLSAQLMTDRDVDDCIDGLIEELNELRGLAKRDLRKNEWLDANRG